jgi:MYXO-CTERM domain-containing protein
MFRLARSRAAAASLPVSLALSLLSSSVAGQTVTNHVVGTQPREIVYNGKALLPWVEAAGARRVDIAGIGDSNQVAGPGSDYGWDHGYAKAWTDRYGEYATGVFGMSAAGAWTGPQGFINSGGAPYGAASTGAPAALDKYKLFYDAQGDGVDDFPANYAYFGPAYQEPTAHWSATTTIRKASSLWGQNLRWNMTYGTFDSGTGKFNPTVVAEGGAPLHQGPDVNTSTGSVGLVDGSFPIPASSYTGAQKDIYLALSNVGAGTMTGPFFGLWQRVEGDKTKGVSYSTMLHQGGQALVHAATALQTQSDDALKEYIRNLVKLQDGSKMLLVQVNHGGNDGGHTIPSVGPSPAPSDTPAGFADNMTALITRLRGAWTALGYDPANLSFQSGPYHPIDGTIADESPVTKVQRLASWENAIVQLSQQHPEYNLAVVRGSRLTTPITMDKDGWYSSATDHGHLSAGGYIGIAELGARQVTGYAKIDELTDRSDVTSLSFTFDSDVLANLSPDDLQLRRVGDDFLSPFDLAVDWDPATLTATWTFQGLPLGELPAGAYEGILKASQLGSLAGGGEAVDYAFTFTASAVPEPGTALGAIALAGLALRRRRR